MPSIAATPSPAPNPASQPDGAWSLHQECVDRTKLTHVDPCLVEALHTLGSNMGIVVIDGHFASRWSPAIHHAARRIHAIVDPIDRNGHLKQEFLNMDAAIAQARTTSPNASVDDIIAASPSILEPMRSVMETWVQQSKTMEHSLMSMPIVDRYRAAIAASIIWSHREVPPPTEGWMKHLLPSHVRVDDTHLHIVRSMHGLAYHVSDHTSSSSTYKVQGSNVPEIKELGHRLNYHIKKRSDHIDPGLKAAFKTASNAKHAFISGLVDARMPGIMKTWKPSDIMNDDARYMSDCIWALKKEHASVFENQMTKTDDRDRAYIKDIFSEITTLQSAIDIRNHEPSSGDSEWTAEWHERSDLIKNIDSQLQSDHVRCSAYIALHDHDIPWWSLLIAESIDRCNKNDERRKPSVLPNASRTSIIVPGETKTLLHLFDEPTAKKLIQHPVLSQVQAEIMPYMRCHIIDEGDSGITVPKGFSAYERVDQDRAVRKIFAGDPIDMLHGLDACIAGIRSSERHDDVRQWIDHVSDMIPVSWADPLLREIRERPTPHGIALVGNFLTRNDVDEMIDNGLVHVGGEHAMIGLEHEVFDGHHRLLNDPAMRPYAIAVSIQKQHFIPGLTDDDLMTAGINLEQMSPECIDDVALRHALRASGEDYSRTSQYFHDCLKHAIRTRGTLFPKTMISIALSRIDVDNRWMEVIDAVQQREE